MARDMAECWKGREMSDELKACPFCGGNNVRHENVRDGRKVACLSCWASSGSRYHGPNNDTTQRATIAWNMRANPIGDLLDNAADRLKVAIEEIVHLSKDDGLDPANINANEADIQLIRRIREAATDARKAGTP